MKKEKIFVGRKGSYKILEHLPDGMLLVKYISGEWNGKEVQMSQALHERIQFKIKVSNRTGEEIRERKQSRKKVKEVVGNLHYDYITITKEKADRIRPILRWIRDGAPGQKERKLAARLLEEIGNVKESGWKQLIVTKGEANLLDFVLTEYPEGVEVGKQLKLI